LIKPDVPDPGMRADSNIALWQYQFSSRGTDQDSCETLILVNLQDGWWHRIMR